MATDTLAVLLGAHKFPYTTFSSTEAFSRSAYLAKTYFCHADWFGLPNENTLDLFDSEESATKQLDMFEAFLTASLSREELPKIKRLVLYYIGHGTFPRNEYCLAVRSSKKSSLARTSIRFKDLAESITSHAQWLQTYIFLDACFAAKGTAYFMADSVEVVKQEVESSFMTSGVTLYCSSPSEKPSHYLPDESATAFTKALISVLQSGIADSTQYLSLRDVESLTWEALQRIAKEARTFDPHFVPMRPEIHTPRRRGEDIARLPFFPNPAYSGQSTTEGDSPPLLSNGVVRSEDSSASLTVQEARRIVKGLPASHKAWFDQLFAIIELHCCLGNTSDDQKVLNFLHRKFQNPVVVDAKTIESALESAKKAVQTLIPLENDDYLFKYKKVRMLLEPLLAVLPSKDDCYDAFSDKPEDDVAAFLVKKYFSDDFLHSHQCIFEVIDALHLGRRCQALLEDNIGRWSWPSIYSKQIERIGTRDLGEQFEIMFKRIRGETRREFLEKAEKEADSRRLKEAEENQKREDTRRLEEEDAKSKEAVASAALSRGQMQYILQRVEQHLLSLMTIEEAYEAKWAEVEPLCRTVQESLKDCFPHVAFRINVAQQTFASVTDVARVLKMELNVLKEKILSRMQQHLTEHITQGEADKGVTLLSLFWSKLVRRNKRQ